jgi:carbonic anhydrase
MTATTTTKPTTARTGLILAALLTMLLTPAVRGSDGVAYSYDPSSSVGPEFWKDLVMDSNQCGGISNSPIAVESQPCTTYADYTFTVRTTNGAADARTETFPISHRISL